MLIENVSWIDVQNGEHTYMGENSILIQITDPRSNFPVPKHKFKEVHQFQFFDADKPDTELKITETDLISETQAIELANLLLRAKYEDMNIIVHCMAGICRSGAVVEVAYIMGFTPTNRYMRIPNVLVKTKMMKYLGLTYDDQ